MEWTGAFVSTLMQLSCMCISSPFSHATPFLYLLRSMPHHRSDCRILKLDSNFKGQHDTHWLPKDIIDYYEDEVSANEEQAAADTRPNETFANPHDVRLSRRGSFTSSSSGLWVALASTLSATRSSRRRLGSWATIMGTVG